MGDDNNKDPNLELLLEKITTLENRCSALESENKDLNTKVDKVTEFNRVLLNKPTKVIKEDKDKDSIDKFNKYLEE